jgi:hypothetical protein
MDLFHETYSVPHAGATPPRRGILQCYFHETLLVKFIFTFTPFKFLSQETTLQVFKDALTKAAPPTNPGSSSCAALIFT